MRAVCPMLLAPLRRSNMKRRYNMQDASHAAMLENIQALSVGPGRAATGRRCSPPGSITRRSRNGVPCAASRGLAAELAADTESMLAALGLPPRAVEQSRRTRRAGTCTASGVDRVCMCMLAFAL